MWASNMHAKSIFPFQMTFQRVATERQISFQEIAEAAKIPENQVEIYVMKAIAKGLIKGAIDEVGRKVHMTWVLPRVLNRQQVHLHLENSPF